MDRSSRMVMLANNQYRSDHKILERFNFTPTYESTKGLNKDEIEILLANYPKDSQLQSQLVSSTDKIHRTRKWLQQTNDMLSKRSNFESEFPMSNNTLPHLISSTCQMENSSYSDKSPDSSEDYIPDTDNVSSSDIESKGTSSTSKSSVLDIVPKLHQTKKSTEPENNIATKSNHVKTSTHDIDITNKGEDKKRRNTKARVWNKRDYCYFCETDVLKFSRHLIRHHSYETEVQEILANKIGSKRRKLLFNKLRNKGNFLKSCFEQLL